MISIGKFSKIKTFGNSMMPMLHDGDVVHFKKIFFSRLKVNDIICYRKRTHMVTHRVIYKKENYVITKGDNNLHSDGKIFPEKILGRVDLIERNGQNLNVDNLYLFQSSIYFDEIKRVVELFKKEKIDFVILKGLPLHLFLEKKHPRRIYADCDILIDKRQYQKVERLLVKIKYKKVVPLSLTGKVMDEKAEISFYKIVNGFYVEFDIHREVVFLMTRVGRVDRLYPQRLVDDLTEKFLSEKKFINVEKVNYPILSPENLVVYLILHIYHHNFEGAYRYEFLKIVLQGKVDYDLVLDMIIKFKLWNFIYATLFLYKNYYDSSFSINPIFIKLKKISNSNLIEKKVMKINIFDEVGVLGEGNYFKMLFSLSPNQLWMKYIVFLDIKILYSVVWVLTKKTRKFILQRILSSRDLYLLKY